MAHNRASKDPGKGVFTPNPPTTIGDAFMATEQETVTVHPGDIIQDSAGQLMHT